MTSFHYKATDRSGIAYQGIMEGDSARQVRDRLRNAGMIPLETHRHDQGSGRAFRLPWAGDHLATADLAMVTRQLSTLIHAGQPLAESLHMIASQATPGKMASLFTSLHRRIQDGHSLAEAMAAHPAVFDVMFRETIAAGERAGRLPVVLQRLADHLDEKDQLRQKIVSALAYPLVVTLFALLVVSILLIHVLPKFLHLFADSSTPLPLMTRLLIDTSHLLTTYWPMLLLTFMLLWLTFSRLLKRSTIRFRLDTFFLKWPVLGQLIRDSHVAGFCRTLATMLASGVPLVEAMAIASRAVTNLPLLQALQQATVKVREGGALAPALQESGFFPPILLHLVAGGEAAGNLSDILHQASSFQERQVASKVAVMSSLFEPLMVVLLGGFVLVIVIAILLPIFELNQMIRL